MLGIGLNDTEAREGGVVLGISYPIENDRCP
jgi:hypothetical protein